MLCITEAAQPGLLLGATAVQKFNGIPNAYYSPYVPFIAYGVLHIQLRTVCWLVTLSSTLFVQPAPQ
jgi:hypothetical protein